MMNLDPALNDHHAEWSTNRTRESGGIVRRTIWGDVVWVFFENAGEGRLHSGGLRRRDQLLHKGVHSPAA